MAAIQQATSTLCAWCIEEQGQEPQEGESHGICEEHAMQVQINYQWAKLQRVASYVERFADGTEVWEDDG